MVLNVSSLRNQNIVGTENGVAFLLYSDCKGHRMQPRDQINKLSWTFHESVKDVTATNLVNAIRSGQLKIEAASVERLLAVIGASADEGYHKGIRAFQKNVDSIIKAIEQDADTVSDLKKPSSKKK